MPLSLSCVLNFPVIIPKKNNKRAVNRRARQNKAPILRLPQISTAVESRKTFRFYGANQATVTSVNILGLLAMNLNSAHQFGGLIASFRVRRISLMGVSGSTIQTCSLLWASTVFGKSVFLTDTSVSTAAPPYITSVPPKNSAASFWHDAGGDELFVLNPSNEEGGAGPVTIVDLELDLVLLNQTLNVITASNSGTTGQIYYGYLDGVGSTSYQPVGGLPYN
jgi:hypothetical protein